MSTTNTLRPPFADILDNPADYLDIHKKSGKKELADLKKIAKVSKVLGSTYVRDYPVVIIGVKRLKEDFGFRGFANSPCTDYIQRHFIAIDATLLSYLTTFRITLHHELAHVLAATYGGKQKWAMQDFKTIAKDGCCPDLDRWSWHMQLAFERLRWVDGTRGLEMSIPSK